jgi:hypothetical protein
MQLTDAQVMTFVIAIVIPLSLLIYSNSRITDAKETLRAETAKLGVELRSEMKDLRAEMKDLRAEMNELRIEFRNEILMLRKDMNAGFERIETALKIHVLEHHS